MNGPLTEKRRVAQKRMLLFGVIVLGTIMAVGRYNSQKRYKDQLIDDRQKLGASQRSSRVINDLVAKYNADKSWRKKELFFTAQAQDALMNGRPVLVVGMLDDISKNSDSKYSLSILNLSGAFVEFTLDADSPSCNQARRNMHGSDNFSFYAVIASVSSIQRETKGDSSQIVATGRCVDLRKIETIPD